MARTPDQTPEQDEQSKKAHRKGVQNQENRMAKQQAEPEYEYTGMEVEPFVPTDVYPTTHVRGKHTHAKKKKRALWAVLLVGGILLLAVGGVFAADEEEDDMATYRRWRRAVCLTRARSPTSRSKEGRRAGERFQMEARVLRRIEREPEPRRPTPFYTQDTTLRETRSPTVPCPSTVTSKTPAEPFRVRATSPPSSDVFDTR